MEKRNNKLTARSFAEAFAGALSVSLAQLTGSPWPLEVVDNREPPAREPQPVQFKVRFEGGLSGDCFVEFYEPQLSELLGKFDGDESNEDSSDRANALLPVLSAAVTQMNSSLSEEFAELTCKIERVSGLACGGMFVAPLCVQADRPSSPSVFVYLDVALLEALSCVSAGQEQNDAAKPHAHPTNLRLVMDVELNVSLRFGQRQLPLREVLELTSGSVIELDRMVDEPVEMLLDGKVIARGEAVIVDGNYGLRVTEIPQALETQLLG